MSFSHVHKSKLWMATQEGVLFMPVPEDFWYCSNFR
jgi:hypothetical protein